MATTKKTANSKTVTKERTIEENIFENFPADVINKAFPVFASRKADENSYETLFTRVTKLTPAENRVFKAIVKEIDERCMYEWALPLDHTPEQREIIKSLSEKLPMGKFCDAVKKLYGIVCPISPPFKYPGQYSFKEKEVNQHYYRACYAFTRNNHNYVSKEHTNFLTELFRKYPEDNYGFLVLLAKYWYYHTKVAGARYYDGMNPYPSGKKFDDYWLLQQEFTYPSKDFIFGIENHRDYCETDNFFARSLMAITHFLHIGRNLDAKIISRKVTIDDPNGNLKTRFEGLNHDMNCYGKFEFTIRYKKLGKDLTVVINRGNISLDTSRVMNAWSKIKQSGLRDYVFMPENTEVDPDVTYLTDINKQKLDEYRKLIDNLHAEMTGDIVTLMQVYESISDNTRSGMDESTMDLYKNGLSLAPHFMSLEEANKKVRDAGNEYRKRKAEEKARQEQEDREERIRRQKDKEFIAYCRSGAWRDNDYCRAPSIQDEPEVESEDDDIEEFDEHDFEYYLTPIEKKRMEDGVPYNIFCCGLVFVCSWNQMLTSAAQYITDAFDIIENGWEVYRSKHAQLYSPNELTGDEGCTFKEFLAIKGYTEKQFFDKWLTFINPKLTGMDVGSFPEAKAYLASQHSGNPDAWVGILPEDKARFSKDEIIDNFRNAVYVHGIQHDAIKRGTPYTRELRNGTEEDVNNYYKFRKENPVFHPIGVQYGG